MGLQITMSIHQQDDIAFDDMDALNTDLMADFNGGFGELYDEFTSLPDWEGPLKLVEGSLRIAENWDSDFGGYGRNSPYGDGEVHNSTMVWGCYNDSVFEIISRHLTQGKLVFFIEIEGNPNEFRIITPGNVESRNESAIRF